MTVGELWTTIAFGATVFAALAFWEWPRRRR